MTSNVIIKATNIEMTQAIGEYIRKKIKDLEKFIDPNDTSVIINVEVSKITKHHKSGDIFRAEINLHISGAQLYAEATTADLYSSIDSVKDEMARELRKQKEKHRARIKKDGGFLKQLLRGFK